MKKIIIGSDKSGFELKEAIKAHLTEIGYEVEDCGTQDPEQPQGYFIVAPKLAKKISDGTYEKGILICGTGMGMAIVANKFPGVYASVCQTAAAAKDAGCAMVDLFLNTGFTDGLEDWRAKNLKNAYATIQDMEKELYK